MTTALRKSSRVTDPKREQAWGVAARSEPRWPASLAVVAAIALYVTLPSRFVMGPSWLIPVLESAVLVPLSVFAPLRTTKESRWAQVLAVALIAIVNVANVVSLFALVQVILAHSKDLTGTELLFTAASIWLTNVIIFALWYWELDRGGPDERLRHDHRAPDFLFPQMSTPGCSMENWTPAFLDYLYVAFTNATAFSPTDTMPLTAGAKTLMMIQSIASLLTITLVAARAVNILS
jgi:uncharacterized membrane protein